MNNLKRSHLWGILLIILGAVMLAEVLFDISIDFFEYFFPVLLIVLGISFFIPKD